MAKLERKQDRIVRRLQAYIVISDPSSYDGSDIDPPPVADAYSSATDRKGKGSARKW